MAQYVAYEVIQDTFYGSICLFLIVFEHKRIALYYFCSRVLSVHITTHI